MKIQIAGRDYTLKVQSEDEEKVKSASKLLNDLFQDRRDNSGITDKQDLLAMIAFDSIFEKMLQDEQQTAINNRLDAVNQQIKEVL